ncbi:hypothetical protein [Microcystis aeruginosa]|nr:hypothetical protein [Microcystis aeruginosa]
MRFGNRRPFYGGEDVNRGISRPFLYCEKITGDRRSGISQANADPKSGY